MDIVMARGLAAQCWCDPRVSNREMDAEMVEVFAEMLQRLSELDPKLMAMIERLNDDGAIPKTTLVDESPVRPGHKVIVENS